MRYFKKLTEAFLMIVICVMFLLMTVAPSEAAINWLQKNVRFSATAGATLVTGDPVYISGSDGKAYKAMADQSTARPCVGIIDKGGVSGKTVEIVVDGVITGMTAASPGGRIYLANSPGGLTATAPTNAEIVGWVLPGAASAATSTTYYIRIQMPKSAEAGY
jgi:hypothetical protein